MAQNIKSPETNPNIQPSALDFSSLRIGTIESALDALTSAVMGSFEEKALAQRNAADAMFNSSFDPAPINHVPIAQREVRNTPLTLVDTLTHAAQSSAVDMSAHFRDQGIAA